VGNVTAIGAATDAALLAVPGITAKHVRVLRQAFPASPAPPDTTPTPEGEGQPG
jgi:hypothetical protein